MFNIRILISSLCLFSLVANASDSSSLEPDGATEENKQDVILGAKSYFQAMKNENKIYFTYSEKLDINKDSIKVTRLSSRELTQSEIESESDNELDDDLEKVNRPIYDQYYKIDDGHGLRIIIEYYAYSTKDAMGSYYQSFNDIADVYISSDE